MKLSWLARACVLLCTICSSPASADVQYRAEEIELPEDGGSILNMYVDDAGNVICQRYEKYVNDNLYTARTIPFLSALAYMREDWTCIISTWSKKDGFIKLQSKVEPWLQLISLKAASGNGHVIVEGFDRMDLLNGVEPVQIRYYVLTPDNSN